MLSKMSNLPIASCVRIDLRQWIYKALFWLRIEMCFKNVTLSIGICISALASLPFHAICKWHRNKTRFATCVDALRNEGGHAGDDDAVDDPRNKFKPRWT